MGCLVLTNAQWTAVQALGNLPVVKRIYNRVGRFVDDATVLRKPFWKRHELVVLVCAMFCLG
jgi:hypothetical protein